MNVRYKKIILIGVVLLLYAWVYVTLPHTTFSGAKTVMIEKGQGSRSIGATLKKEGVIGSRWTFIAYVMLTDTANRLRPGTFVFENNASLPKIVSMLTQSGRSEKIITIPEGWNAWDITEYLNERGVASEDDLQSIIERARRPAALDRFLFIRELPERATLEGYLFPDTYRVFSDATAEDVVIKMLENFDEKITQDMRPAIEKMGNTPHEIIIMASLIEKEVTGKEDRALISGILWKRLKNGMPLQVDATINYITKNRTTKVTLTDTKVESPYNTYKYPGLPAGPIANPGLEAIRAALYPKESPYFFYLSTPDGTTIFSRTLDEHNIAKARYLK